MQDQRKILGLALVICKNPLNNKYLGVHECDQTWWVAGGRVDAPQSFSDGAKRQCVQEAGINVELKGLLRIEQSLGGYGFERLKIIFYGQPIDPHQVPKQKADKDSIKAAYLSLEQIIGLKAKWRGPQLYEWANYLQQGGKIYPLSILQESPK